MARSRLLGAAIALICATGCGNAAGRTIEADPCEHHREIAYELSKDKSPAGVEAVASQVVRHPECWEADLVASAQKLLVQVRQQERDQIANQLWLDNLQNLPRSD